MATLQELIMTGQVTFFALSRHEDVSAILRDASFSSNEDNWEGRRLIEPVRVPALAEVMDHWMLFMDAPDHTRIRSLVNRAFTARRVEKLRTRIEELTDELLDALANKAEADLMAEFAFALPIRVICELLGVPREAQAQFRQASRDLASVLDLGPPPAEDIDRMEASARPFVEYLRSLIDERRRHPDDDLLSALIAARDEQDKLSDAELLGTVSLVLGAGFETTMNLIGNGAYTLLRHPDELARLRADPTLVASTVEEILRFEPPVMVTARTSLADTEVGGNKIHRGQQGILMLAAANKDADVFDKPDRFDITRRPNPHLTFGGGSHFCPGAALARLEGQIALGKLFGRFPNLALRDEPTWRQTVTLHGLNELWVRL